MLIIVKRKNIRNYLVVCFLVSFNCYCVFYVLVKVSSIFYLFLREVEVMIIIELILFVCI